jgi:Holliday junction DNA helicase RuvB
MIILAFFVLWIIIGIIIWVKKEKPEEEITIPVETEEIDELADMLTPKLTESYLRLENYIGQENVVEYLLNHIRKAKKDDSSLPHVILWGGGGLGKSTLMKATAEKMGGRFIELVPANLRNAKELFGIFFLKTCYDCGQVSPYSCNKCLHCKNDISIYYEPYIQVQDKDIIFLEECHGLNQSIEEALYSLMQDKYMQIRYNGVDQRVMFPDITIAGATTQLGDLRKPFRDRFKLDLHLEPYSKEEITIIGGMYAKHKGLEIGEDALKKLGKISHGVPRKVKKYIDDASTISSHITLKELEIVLNLLRIDENGLDGLHRKIMAYILMRMQSMKNGAAGATAIASATGIPSAVYAEVYEPALLYNDLLFHSSKGRRLTEKAMEIYFPDKKETIK